MTAVKARNEGPTIHPFHPSSIHPSVCPSVSTVIRYFDIFLEEGAHGQHGHTWTHGLTIMTGRHSTIWFSSWRRTIERNPITDYGIAQIRDGPRSRGTGSRRWETLDIGYSRTLVQNRLENITPQLHLLLRPPRFSRLTPVFCCIFIRNYSPTDPG